MKLLIIGNHTCGNRGDGAILRGLAAELKKQSPHIKIDMTSRFPVSSEYLINESFLNDDLYAYYEVGHSLKLTLKKRFEKKLLPYSLAKKLSNKKVTSLPKHIQQQVSKLKQYDAVIQVGGSFFVDLYGATQFEFSLCALLAERPLFLLGHSVGPFGSKRYARLADFVFSRVDMLALREPVSLSMMKTQNIAQEKVTEGADTAWLVDNDQTKIPDHLSRFIEHKPTIAVSVRKLAPFDKRLGVSQEAFEAALSNLLNKLVYIGYQIVIVSTCTGIDGYKRDDRMVALQVQKRILDKESCLVVMDELNDVELGSLLSLCKLTIGTRLHSAIISMNFGTPAIAINYEHKSEGIMAQLGLPELSSSFDALMDGRLLERVKKLLEQEQGFKAKLAEHVEYERIKARKMISQALSKIQNHS